MARFRDIKALQKIAAAHTKFHNHFNQNRHLNHRDIFKQNHVAALPKLRQLAAGEIWPSLTNQIKPSQSDNAAA